MWSKLSSKTPCVLIECGVGMHVPDDWQILHFNRPLVVEGIVKGICLAFNVPYAIPTPVPEPTPEPPVVEPKPPVEPEPVGNTCQAQDLLISKVKTLANSRWTWIGKTNSWKKRLSDLKELLS